MPIRACNWFRNPDTTSNHFPNLQERTNCANLSPTYKVLDLPSFSVSQNQSGGNSAVDKRKKQHHALQKRNQRGQRRLRRSPGGKERGGGRTVQSFGRILRKVGAWLASLRLTRRGMASLPCSSSSWRTHLSMGTDHRIFLESWIPEVLGKDRQERQRAEVTCPT